MKKVVDASVLLAVMREEIADWSVLVGAVVSAVNLAEVLSRASDLNLSGEVLDAAIGLLLRVEPFYETQAYRSGELRPLTRAAGLSLCDRACLALALELDADVYTADRVWTTLNLPPVAFASSVKGSQRAEFRRIEAS